MAKNHEINVHLSTNAITFFTVCEAMQDPAVALELTATMTTFKFKIGFETKDAIELENCKQNLKFGTPYA